MTCRIPNCINPAFCTERDACCAGDPECTAEAVKRLERNLRAQEDWQRRGCPPGEIVDTRDPEYVPPQRIVVDEETGERIAERIANPRPPNEKLRALFKK